MEKKTRRQYAPEELGRNRVLQLRHSQKNSHDITERRQAEQRLESSEICYRRLFEAAYDGILILDVDECRIAVESIALRTVYANLSEIRPAEPKVHCKSYEIIRSIFVWPDHWCGWNAVTPGANYASGKTGGTGFAI
jgi:hypothetical protein